jgi:AmmeMemoRadiSam system protein A
MSRPATFQLTENDQLFLLTIARNSVGAYLSGEVFRPHEVSNGTLSQSFGIFVSIHKNHDLRGCIGTIHGVGPLYRSVGECAVSAAVADPRFSPMTMDELALVDFEISVLSPMQQVNEVSEIEVGKHGLWVSKSGCRGLLLPQVAAINNWDRIMFLEETCRKAGLNPDDWRDGAAISCFTAFVFGEKRPQLTAAS